MRPDRRHALRGAALVSLGIASAAIWALGLPPGHGTQTFALRAMLLGALQLGAIALAFRRDDRRTIVIVLASGLAFRALAWSWPPELSSDLHRYVWDGRVQAAGVSPYRYPPAAPQLAELRDDTVWPRINRPEAITVYPPGTQVAFRLLWAVGGRSVWHVKTAALLADLGVLALLLFALGRAGLPRGRIAIHAWSPLVVAEVCCSGHVDALVVLLIVGALLALVTLGRPVWAGLLLGAATACKLYPALLFAAIARDRWRAAAAGAAVVATGYVAYGLGVGRRVLGFLPDYVRSGEDFNAGLRGLLEWALGPTGRLARPLSMGLCAVALAGVALVIARRRDRDAWTAARDLALAFVLLLPTAVHPWYAMWLVPLLVLRPSAAGLWIVSLLPLSYAKYGAPGGRMPPWIPLVEWLPAFALLAAERWRLRARGLAPAPAARLAETGR